MTQLALNFGRIKDDVIEANLYDPPDPMPTATTCFLPTLGVNCAGWSHGGDLVAILQKERPPSSRGLLKFRRKSSILFG